jgi:RNA polymerase sigma factor for flagellar operon FliA
VNKADEQKLWARFKERGDEDARQDLIVEYMRTVRYIAGRMAIHVPASVEMDDLVSWGVLGLLDAVDKYDHKQDIRFSTYASIRIRGAIIDQIRSLDWAPRSLRTLARKIGAARDKLRHELGAEPTYLEIAEEVGVSAEQVEETLAQVQTAQVLALDDYLPSDEDGEGRKVDLTTDAGAQTPEEAAEIQEKQELLVQAILALPEQQQKVLNLYYYEELTLKEIGAVLEVSESRVCQIHSAAMKSLRKAMREARDASTG